MYNWQFTHSVDFWCIVLAKACSKEAEIQTRKESAMKPLIYPLVQVALGAIKSVIYIRSLADCLCLMDFHGRLIPNSRSYPFHLQIIRSILNLTKHTEIYVPISPHLVPMLTSTISPSSRHKASTLKPLDFETQIRVPQQYVKTRVFSEGITEESIFLLAEWLSSPVVHGSVGFPEIVVPIVVLLRRSLKAAKTNSSASGTSKEQTMMKTFLERVEESAKWVENQRKEVAFTPGKITAVAEWEKELRKNLKDAALCKYLKVQIRAREKRRKLLEKVGCAASARPVSSNNVLFCFFN